MFLSFKTTDRLKNFSCIFINHTSPLSTNISAEKHKRFSTVLTKKIFVDSRWISCQSYNIESWGWGKHQLVLQHRVPDCWGRRIRWIWCLWWVGGLVVPSTGAAFSGVVSGCCCCWIICMRSSVEMSLPSGPGSKESSVGVDTEIYTYAMVRIFYIINYHQRKILTKKSKLWLAKFLSFS